MILVTELAAAPVLSKADPDALALVSQAAADIRLGPGEYATPRPGGCPRLARDAHGYVLTGEAVVKAGRWGEDRDPYLLETSVPGIFACGDVRASLVKRVAAAVGEGSMAIAFVHQYLQRASRPAA